jgi:hypothetical protein
MSTHTLDMNAHYRVDGMPGIAWWLDDYVKTPRVDEETGELVRDWLGECDDAYDIDRSRVLAVMVGDDGRHEVDVEDLEAISDEDFCACCGQIGCGWS